ncbi:MAG TPA: hypothetical protein PLV68_19560, partial [Ilumatobacteraceae bacterium]|nr:hypothetical protein [Ilumatobacteraceae bacterium]
MVLLALLPTVGFAAAWRWADDKAKAEEQPPVVSYAPPPGAGVTALDAPVLSVRRAPSALVESTSEAALVNELVNFAGFLNDTSCLAVSLSGRTVFTHNA